MKTASVWLLHPNQLHIMLKPLASAICHISNAMAAANKGNSQSISDMSKTTDFGDQGHVETSGPVKVGTKNDVEQKPAETPVNYSQAMNNGPVYKGEPNNDEEDVENKENG